MSDTEYTKVPTSSPTKMILEHKPQPVSTFRRLLPQILASAAKNMLILDLGMAISFPTIAIPALRGTKNRDPDEFLVFDDHQASWFASIAYICQPIGSLLSGVVLEQLGRKKAMMIVNIPHIVAWLMLFYAKDLTMLFAADVLLGLGIGFMEAPVLTYVGEIAEPSVRGVLTAIAGVSYALGTAILYAIGNVLNWRSTALVCCSIPIATIVCISMVPETPMWLLTKNRKQQALKSLQWLRGWVEPELVREEFEQLERYTKVSNQSRHGDQMATFGEKFKELKRQKSLKPLFIIICCFFFAAFNVVQSMKAYYVQIFDKYDLAVEPGTMTVYMGLMGTIANICCSICIKIFGKRRITICSMAATLMLCSCLTIYTWKMLPSGMSSFDELKISSVQGSYIPMVIFLCLAFFTNFGITAIPWVMVGEIFPTKLPPPGHAVWQVV